MRTRRTLTIAATIGALVLTAGTAFAAGATTSQDGALQRNPVEAMSSTMNGWDQPHADPAGSHRERGTPMDEAGHAAMHRDGPGPTGSADHGAMHAQMREHMPADLREDCDAHHDEHAPPDA